MDWHIGAKEIIRQAGVTQDQLVSVFGVGTPSAVGHYLNGRRQPRPAQLKSLADYLGVRIDDFFENEDAVSAAPAPSVTERLRERATCMARRQPLGVRYDWSNPGGMSEQAFIHKVLAGGRFKDILTLSTQIGIDHLDATVMADTDLSSRPRLQRVLQNIRHGHNQAKAHAA